MSTSVDNAVQPSRIVFNKKIASIFYGNYELIIGIITITSIIFIWEYARQLGIPGVREIEPPSSVISASSDLILSWHFWEATYKSFLRIMAGFILAQVVGIPLGIVMATSRRIRNFTFPLMEMLRPIPPVAWIPVAIIFWPTREMSTVSIVFLGAFWIVVLNTLGGASNIDAAYKRAAASLGSSRWQQFRYIIFPATLPSILTGMVVGMGISWEMVVAAEMISGDTGLGYLLWQSFEINARAQVLVCMIAIGIAGFLSSYIILRIGRIFVPWQERR